MIRKTIVVLFIIYFFQIGIPGMAAQEEVPKYPFRHFSQANLRVFFDTVSRERSNLFLDLQKKYSDNPQKILGNPDLIAYDRIIALVNKLEKDLADGEMEEEQELTFQGIQRLHYGVLSDITNPKQPSLIVQAGKTIINLVAGPLVLKVPTVRDPFSPVGPTQAMKEGKRLFRSNGKIEAKLSEISRLNPIEISRLQPSSQHPAINPLPPGNHFADFEREIIRLIRAQGGKLSNFDPAFARRVLFYDGLKDDATSPKITTKDRFGVTWGLKWGNEVHTDVPLTRLYIDLGGTFTDLKYYSGPGETILVLNPPGKENLQSIVTFEDLAKILLKSRFKFHAKRVILPSPILKDKSGSILGSGLIDKKMAEQMSIDEKYVGANYVLFKECQLSLYNPAIKRLGGTSLENVGAMDDRVTRSSIVFNCWIRNRDVKEDNTRIGLLYNSSTGDFDNQVEFISDLGCSLGGLMGTGVLNKLEDSFILYFPNSINFVMKPYYRPRSWSACTWADARWMALRIAALKREDLEREFSESGWPSFMQKLVVEKLLSRRNELVDAFSLSIDGVKKIPCDPDLTIEVNGETVVKKGKIRSNSKTVQKLEEVGHPEGLVRIVPTFLD